MLRRYVLLSVVIALVGVSAFAITRQLAPDDPNTRATSPESLVVDAGGLAATREADQAKPRFVGEILGIFIAPTETDWPEALRKDREARVSGGCTYASRDRAGDLDFAEEPVVTGFIQTPEEPVVVQCSGSVTGVNREYQGMAASGAPATLLIARGVSRAWGADVAVDSVTEAKIGGRDAIIIKPATPDGIGQTSLVIFPEPFGITIVYAFSLSETELLAVAEAVAAVTR